jgi:Flp pilus assembly protein TadG
MHPSKRWSRQHLREGVASRNRTVTRLLDRLRTDERGSAALEFITAGMILLVPLVYLILALAQLQAGALAVEGAARQAARVYVQSATPESAADDAERAIQFALADYGVDVAATRVAVSCRPVASDCLTRRGYVTVSIEIAVPLPLAPVALTVDAPLSLPVRATATQQVSRFWTAE